MPSADLWVTRPVPNPGAQVRLFCFPYAGGGASTYRTWAKELPPEIEVCPIQLPGRENRFHEDRFTRLELLVPVLGDILSPYLDTPFTFFGHSMGALLAFELARYLRTSLGVLPQHLFVSAHRAPQLPDRHPPIHRLPEPLFIQELSRLNGTPEAILAHAELMDLLIPLLRADFTLAETYTYRIEEALACPIIALGGESDQFVRQEELIAWNKQTSHSFFMHHLSGDHFFLQENRSSILRVISKLLKPALLS